MPEHESLDKRAPITVKYEIPYFTVSGIQVRYLKIVEKSGYQALPWVRYITQNGDDYRCAPACSSPIATRVCSHAMQLADGAREGQRADCADVSLVLRRYCVDLCDLEPSVKFARWYG